MAQADRRGRDQDADYCVAARSSNEPDGTVSRNTSPLNQQL